MRRFWWIALVGLMFIGGKPERAAACSGVGGYRAWLSDALDSEYVVIGQFVELDDAELNGIFRVDEYLAGRAGEYLLLALNSAWTIRNPRVICSSALSPLEMETSYLFFLTRQLDGSFESAVWMLFPYSDEETKYTLHVDWDREREVYITQEFSFDELRATILAHEAHDSYMPLPARHPLIAPILLTTLDDEQYLVPVDGATPVRLSDEQITGLRIEPIGCRGIPCQARSPNRIDEARLVIEGQELRLTYPVIQLQARAVLFSSNSELLAV